MEIIHVVLGKVNPERMNGVNKVVYQLVSRQVTARKNASVWGITNELSHNYGERNFETRLFKAQTNPFTVDKSLVQAIQGQKGKAVFHLHGGWVPTFSKVSALLYHKEIPFVFTPHGAYNTIAMQRSKWRKKLYFQLFEKQLLNRAAKIHCIGQSEVSGIRSIYPTNKTFLLPYGFEINPIPVRQDQANQAPFTLGFVGRLDIYTKGLDVLLSAFAAFQRKVKNTQLWIVGDSTERNKLDKMISAKHLQGKVTLWGSKYGWEKEELMQKMHLFAHPSRNEGLPSAVLEASAMGIPCIVTRATNVGEAIVRYQSGLVIENEDVAALEKAIHDLYQQWKENRLTLMAANAQKMVKVEFSWNRIIHAFDELYQVS
ncbi:glycosyltransferase family 4 protein [Rapidithrix thailandica]|uniref:Glycosyltransferase family 4 protein n=1 Tax=Rapidithrix thailandica TaxID=413964 RepID=A0AAW9SAG6_9BACT